jgi:dihydroorotate dehydrogenase (fumarate)
MYSLFQEQIEHDAALNEHYLGYGTESFPEALSYVPPQVGFPRGPDEYLEHLAALKSAVDVPVIASLNGISAGGWTEYAKSMQQAGANAIELNLYHVAADPETTGAAIEDRYVDVLRAVRQVVAIPVAVKLSPYFSALANFARRLDRTGADGLVLFNRFYQPDIDLENLEVRADLRLSTPHEMRLPLRWIAILNPLVRASLAATTGIYTSFDVLKLTMVGADAAMLCATLLRNGTAAVGHILAGMREWMEDHGYSALKQMRGSMNQLACSDPEAFERGNYIKALNWYSACI